MSWYIEDILNNNSLTVKLYAGDTEICRGFLNSSAELDITHSYSDGQDSLMGAMVEGINQGRKFVDNTSHAVNNAIEAIDGGIGFSAQQKRDMSKYLLAFNKFRREFQGTNVNISIGDGNVLETLFIAGGPNDSIIAGKPGVQKDIIAGLKDFLQPLQGSFEVEGGGLSAAQYPPNGYFVPGNIFDNKPDGTFKFIIGGKGTISNLKLDNVKIEILPARDFDGNPLLAKARLTLSSATLFNQNDIASFLV